MDRILKVHLSLIMLCISIMMFSHTAYATALNTYYNDENVETISNGVTRITSKKITNRGLVDVQIVKIDLKNKDLKFENLSNKQFGKKTTVKNLIANKPNVVAAVNGDFFEMSLNPSFELGISMNNGELERISSGEYYNCYSNSLASLLLDGENEPFIDFVKPEIVFANDNDTLYLSYYNKIGDKIGTVYLSGEFFSSTQDMDKRSSTCYKILVEDDEIVEIFEPEISIDITPEQYVIFVPASFERIQNFKVGDKVKIDVKLNISDEIETAIGGAGIIIKDGNLVEDGYIIKGYTARTAIGFDSSKRYLYLATVGGLNSINVGVSHYQLGEILLEYGVYNAMHLDGGGSTTMLGKGAYDEKIKFYNKLSSQRAILNAFVVTNDAKDGDIAGIKIKFNSDKAVKNSSVSYEVIAYDKNHKVIDEKIDLLKLEITSDDAKIDKENSKITFNNEGRSVVKASYEGFEDKISIDIYDSVVEVVILPDPIEVEIGAEVELQIIALTEEKYKITVDARDAEYILSSNIAKVENGKVVGLKQGAGTIGVKFNGLEAYSALVVGTTEKTLEKFNSIGVESQAYPETVECDARLKSGKLRIDYTFNETDETQAAYAKFKENIEIPKGAKKLSVNLTGDASKNLFKVKLVDSNDDVYTLTMCENIDFEETRKIEVNLPTGYTGTLKIERFYIASLQCEEKQTSSIDVDDVNCIIPMTTTGIKVPNSVKLPAKTKNESIIELSQKDILFFNNSVQNTLMSKYIDDKINQKYANQDIKCVLAKNTEKLNGILASGSFTKQEIKDLDTAIVTLSTIKGSAYAKDPYQYAQLENFLQSTKLNNIVIVLDGDLTTSSLLPDKTMLEYILNKYYEERRVNYFVVMFTGSTNVEKLDNGIRYIRVPSTLSDAYAKNIFIMRKVDDKLTYNFVDLHSLIKSIKNEKNTQEVDKELLESQNTNEINSDEKVEEKDEIIDKSIF